MFTNIDMTAFPPEREVGLKSIYRYSSFEVAMYRSNLWMHSRRVLWILEELLPLAQKYLNIDPEKARALALVHDDAEMITGDVPSRAKTLMSKEETTKMERDEEDAARTLSEKFPKTVNGFVYHDLLMHAIQKDCTEAYLVSYADKLDAYCESMHEVLAGNISLLRSVMFYTNAIALFATKFPALTEFLKDKTSPFTYTTDIISPYTIKTNAYINKPHTIESVHVPTDFPFYNAWRKMVIERAGDEGVRWLTKQKETL